MFKKQTLLLLAVASITSAQTTTIGGIPGLFTNDYVMMGAGLTYGVTAKMS